MAKRVCSCLMLIIIALLFVPCEFQANPAPRHMSGGAVAAKRPHETISMVAEDVIVRLGRRSYTVVGEYHMHNYGPSISETVGFPKDFDRDSGYDRDYPDFVQFHVWVNGKKVGSIKDGKRWIDAEITFTGESETIIRVLYESYYPVTMTVSGFANYVIGTGRLWKNTIRDASFTVDGSAIGGTKGFEAKLISGPKSRKLVTDQTIRFDAKNFKPKREAALIVTLNRGRWRLY